MKRRTLGNSGLQVFPVGLGCMGLSQSYQPFPDKEKRLRENMSAAYVELPEADWDKLEQRVSGIQICGERYSPAMLEVTGQ